MGCYNRFIPNPSCTDSCVLKDTARCPLSYSKGFRLLPETTLPLAGEGFPSEVGKPVSYLRYACRKLRLCRETTKSIIKMNKKKNGDETPKWGRHPKESRKSHCVMVRFDNEEWQKFLAMYEKSGVYARAVFLKAHFFGQPFRVLVTDRTLLDYCTKLSAFHAQYRMVGNNYNQTVRELRCHFSEKKAMALLYKLEQCTKELAALTRQVMELSKEFEERWSRR